MKGVIVGNFGMLGGGMVMGRGFGGVASTGNIDRLGLFGKGGGVCSWEVLS